MTTLLEEIETFIAGHDMRPSTFGHLARGDKHLVKQLRNGRRMWPETEAKIRQFMRGYVAEARVSLCELCKARPDDPTVRACVHSDCPNRERRVA